jgi:hypothetical protein
MGGGGGIQLRVQLHGRHTCGLAQGVHSVQHPKPDVDFVLCGNPVDLRQGQSIGANLRTAGGTGSKSRKCKSGKNSASQHYLALFVYPAPP